MLCSNSLNHLTLSLLPADLHTNTVEWQVRQISQLLQDLHQNSVGEIHFILLQFQTWYHVVLFLALTGTESVSEALGLVVKTINFPHISYCVCVTFIDQTKSKQKLHEVVPVIVLKCCICLWQTEGCSTKETPDNEAPADCHLSLYCCNIPYLIIYLLYII